jgi:hypothetical protein
VPLLTDPVRYASDRRRPLCQECSDPIEATDLRVRTQAGMVHADCAELEPVDR